MNKLHIFALVAFLGLASTSYAVNTANINIKISGAFKNNQYLLCEEDLGCFSIPSGEGKVYPMTTSFEMNTLFISDVSTMRIYNIGLPRSCNTSIKDNQTLTIYGKIEKRENKVTVTGLHCTVE